MDMEWTLHGIQKAQPSFCSFQTIPLILETSTTAAESVEVHATQTPQPMQLHQVLSFDFFAVLEPSK